MGTGTNLTGNPTYQAVATKHVKFHLVMLYSDVQQTGVIVVC